MTFYEAAIEVLKGADRPLHYKKITELAIRKKLLSHVGKTPEVTMGARLVQEIERADKDVAIVRTRPGVYALREWKQGDRRRRERRGRDDKSAEEGREEHGAAERGPSSGPARGSRAPISSADLYAGEDIFEDSEEEEDESGDDERRGHPRKRRRRRRRDTSESQTEASTDERRAAKDDATDAEKAADSDEHPPRSRERDEPLGVVFTGEYDIVDGGEFESEDVESEDVESEDDKSEDEASRHTRDAGDDRGERRRRRERRGGGKSIRRDRVTDSEQSLVPTVLRVLRKAKKAMAPKALAEAVAERIDTEGVAAATYTAVLETDNHVRRTMGRRPLFSRDEQGRWELTEWSFDRATLKTESRLYEAVKQLRGHTIAALGEKLAELELSSWRHVVLALLKQRGYSVHGMTQTGPTTLVVRAEKRVGLSTERVAVALCDVEEVGAQHVTELRGTLHHHDASSGVIITTNHVGDDAIEESQIANLANIVLIGRKQLARMLIDAGIGVRRVDVPVHFVHYDFFDHLNGG